MRFKTWPVAALGLSILVLVVGLSVLAVSKRAEAILHQLDELTTHHRSVESKLRRLRSDVHLSGIYVRDFLLDRSDEAIQYRQQLTDLRQSNRRTLEELRSLTTPENDARVERLQTQLDEYWQTFEPLFGWSPAERAQRSAEFLRIEALPRRDAVLGIAREIEDLNNANLETERAEVEQRRLDLRQDLRSLLWQSLLLGLVIALIAVSRLRVLERRAGEERALVEDAERRTRQLSQQLVAAQEEERRRLSRELHDHVGQMLTALRMELGRIDRLRVQTNVQAAAAIAESRRLVDDVVRTVRDLALGLRPSMLDDLGLQPALEWLARDVSRRFGLPVDVRIERSCEHLPDQHRTCVYRVVQEALTNCVRHASAQSAEVRLAGPPDRLDLTVSDDGVGFDGERSGEGFGLRGIEERVRELGGWMDVVSSAGHGTRLSIHLPIPAESAEDSLARAAG